MLETGSNQVAVVSQILSKYEKKNPIWLLDEEWAM